MSIATRIEGGVARLTLNRPDRLNALTMAMLDEVAETLRHWSIDPAIRCVVLTGAGRGFCAGYDLSGSDEPARDTPIQADEAAARMALHGEIPVLLRRMPKPTLASIRGPAAGSGMVMAAACDLRIASTTARFKLAFASAGRCGDPGGGYLLTQLLGPAQARALYLLDEPVDAQKALALGLVTRVVDDEALDEACDTVADQLANGPTSAFAAMKRNLNAAADIGFEESMAAEAMANATLSLHSHDAKEAAHAFLERRPPRFLGF